MLTNLNSFTLTTTLTIWYGPINHLNPLQFTLQVDWLMQLSQIQHSSSTQLHAKMHQSRTSLLKKGCLVVCSAEPLALPIPRPFAKAPSWLTRSATVTTVLFGKTLIKTHSDALTGATIMLPRLAVPALTDWSHNLWGMVDKANSLRTFS